jgi:hypothetical protein
VEKLALAETKVCRERGVELRKKNLGYQRLGSRGYLEKKPIYRKEDEARALAGKLNPFDGFKDEHANGYIRSRNHEEKDIQRISHDTGGGELG